MNTLVNPNDLIDQAEAAELSGLSLSGFKLAWREERTPPPFEVAGRPLWLRSEIEEWAAERAAQRSR